MSRNLAALGVLIERKGPLRQSGEFVSTRSLLAHVTELLINVGTGNRTRSFFFIKIFCDCDVKPNVKQVISGSPTILYALFMMTSSNGNIFRVTGHLCGEFTSLQWIPHTKASDAGLWCFFYLRPNKRLSKHWWGWWFETPSRPLWRHCNVG